MSIPVCHIILLLSLGSEHFVQVLPQMIVADQAILSIAPKKRLCYLSEEKPLAFYKYYSQVILLPVGSAQTVLLKVRPTLPLSEFIVPACHFIRLDQF